MKIYLDTCCFGRLFDDLSQDRIYYENLAILAIMKKRIKSDYILVGSDMVLFEISKVRENSRRDGMIKLYSYVDYTIKYNNDIKMISQNIQSNSYIKRYDSLHIASAEYGQVDVFLTTDDKLVKRSQDPNLGLSVRLMNPISYILKVI